MERPVIFIATDSRNEWEEVFECPIVPALSSPFIDPPRGLLPKTTECFILWFDRSSRTYRASEFDPMMVGSQTLNAIAHDMYMVTGIRLIGWWMDGDWHKGISGGWS